MRFVTEYRMTQTFIYGVIWQHVHKRRQVLLIPFAVAILETKLLANLVLVCQNSTQLRTYSKNNFNNSRNNFQNFQKYQIS